MAQSRTVTYRPRVRAAHKVQVVEVVKVPTVAGKRFHFIGAGGIGMSGLARMLLEKKARVSGSDMTGSTVTDRLRELGADIQVGHREENLAGDTDVVITSAAIREDNPELKLARQRGYEIRKYAQMLGELMNYYEGIAVSGTHGKSTTTGWLVSCLKQTGIDTNFVVGADIGRLNCSSGTGDSEYFVAEACEYDRSFLNLRPKIACILNIDRDHLDCYESEDAIIEAFGQFARQVKPNGMVLANGDDPNVRRLLGRIGPAVYYETFGFDPGCTFRARSLRHHKGLYSFEVVRDGVSLGRTHTSIPGRHNVLNGLAVVAMAVTIGVEPQRVLGALPGFSGMDRRMMLKARVGGITVLDDYAHHPTEIQATLEAIRQHYRPKRLWCVFQPHQCSRTHLLLDDFARSFAHADVVIVPEIYSVRDTAESREKIDSAGLVRAIQAQGADARHIGDFDAVCRALQENVGAGDVVVSMGAGDVWKVADEFVQRLR